MNDWFSFAQNVIYGSIQCPVCETKFVDNNLGQSEHSVSVELPNGSLISHETCGGCGNWQGESLADIEAGNVVEL